MKRLPLLFYFIVSALNTTAQDGKIKFGNISENDFAPKVYSLDSNAAAVVIADIGSSRIEGNNKGAFSLIYKHYRRVHILNKNGFDLTNISIFLHYDGDAEESLDRVRAVTYNLENGKVVSSKLDEKNGVFKDKISKSLLRKKFTLPNVKEGSIIEFEYTIISDFLQYLRPWEFQGSYPRLTSQYEVSIPEFLGYITLGQGYRTYDVNEVKDRRESFSLSLARTAGPTERAQFSSNVADRRYVINNVPALKEEKFTSTLDNHIQKIEFQLSEIRPPLEYRRVMENWEKVAENLMKAPYFGESVTRDNGWLTDLIAPLKVSSSNKTGLVQKIYAWVRDNFTCTNHNRVTTDQTLKNLVKTHSGSVSEINLLLTAMLFHENIDASPVILSTRSNGFTYSIYPLLSQYNYVICRAIVDGKTFYLDASEPHLGFNRIPLACYNGHARVINSNAEAIEFVADSLMESKFSSVFIVNDEKGNLVGSMVQTPGYYESYEMRERAKEKGKNQMQADIQKDFGSEVIISNFGLDSLDKYDELLSLHYDFDLKGEKEDIIYLNPMFGEGYKENPFKSAERFYPVEMPYAFDETYNLQMEVPQGYVVDELPKSILVKLNEESEGIFEYRITQSGDNISFRSRLRINRAYFAPDEYEMLREFFNLIVKKQAEQIVFKKKK